MNEEKIKTLLAGSYEITLSGGHLGYILKVMADEQHRLNERAEKNILDPMNSVLAAANDIVGNELLHEVYKSCGSAFLAFAMNVDEADIDKLMKSTKPSDIQKAGEAIAKKNAEKRNKKMN